MEEITWPLLALQHLRLLSEYALSVYLSRLFPGLTLGFTSVGTSFSPAS